MAAKGTIPYEAPTVTYYGDVASLTASVTTKPNSDALCIGTGTAAAGVPSGVVCKQTGPN